ncbi:MAG TPA: biotin transporter BioY [Planctomycetota bacterium]|nr:biotin transporter BioY [Planctomycetota bacterium]
MPYVPALAQRWFPARTWLRECAVVASGAALVAALAQVSVPLHPVPLTGQTLGVLLVGCWLGCSRGGAALTLYVGAGAAGLPVFAGGAFGLQVLAGTTGGYLVGFVVSAALAGFMAEAGLMRTFPRAVPSLFLASVPIHALGLVWLSRFVPERALLDLGFWPFVAFDPLKIGLAAAIVSGTSERTPRARR